jgi:site-specific DNA-cytosine methylase
MPTFISGFSGGGLADMGLIAAGYEPIGAVEMDPAIAEVYKANIGPHVRCESIMDTDWTTFDRPDLLWMSPECKEFSRAKVGGKEGPTQCAQAEAICRAIATLTPPTVVIENVLAYQRSVSLQRIVATLYEHGYFVAIDSVNAANMGGLVPCPIHDTNSLTAGVRNAGSNSPRGIAPDIVASSATMLPADQARILAWDVLALLVRETAPSTAVAATWRELASAGHEDQQTPDGRAGGTSTTEAMSEFELMESIGASIASWLNRCSGDRSLLARWSTTSTETRRITTHLICGSIQATARTPQITTPSGVSGGCPLCRIMSVPQTRVRLILRAVRGELVPHLPGGRPWVGWHAAIADLLPDLPESRFAPWQLARLDALFGDTLVHPTDMRSMPTRAGGEPSFAVMANSHEDSHTPGPRPRAFLVPSVNANAERGKGYREGGEPAITCTGQMDRPSRMPRAFLVPGGHTSNDVVRDGASPACAIAAGHDSGSLRALLVGTNGEHGSLARAASDPAQVVTAAHDASTTRPWSSQGRVVAMTPRALARFQSVPDSYTLPEKRGLACKVVGNGVACLVAQAVGESLKGVLS